MEGATLESLQLVSRCTLASELPGCTTVATVGLHCLDQQSSYSTMKGFLQQELGVLKDCLEDSFDVSTRNNPPCPTLLPNTLHLFSARCAQFLLSCSRLAECVLDSSKNREFHSKLAACWSKLVVELLQKVIASQPARPLEAEEVSGSAQSWEECLGLLSVVCAVVKVAESVRQIGTPQADWLCRSSLTPTLQRLASSVPDALYREYQAWLRSDEEGTHTVMTPQCSRGSGGKVFRCVHMLADSALLLATVAKAYGDGCKQFYGSATETVLRLTNHYWEQLTQMVKCVPSSLPLRVLYLALSSAHHLHSTLHQLALGRGGPLEAGFSCLMHCLEEFCRGTLDHVISYHCELCVTSLLQDASSNDWSSHSPFFEGERCSYTVQMWRYYLQGLQHDAWELLGGEMAVKLLAKVLRNTLHFLALRYTSVCPSEHRTSQYRADVLAILFATASMVPFITPPDNLSPHSSHIDMVAINGCCAKLLATLAASSVGEGEGRTPKVGGIRKTPSSAEWMECLPLERFGIPRVVSPWERLSERLPQPPTWPLLLEVLLVNDGALSAFLCMCEGGEGGEVLQHVARILGACHQAPWALSSLCSSCCNGLCTSVAEDNRQKQAPPPHATPNSDMGNHGVQVTAWLAKTQVLQASFHKAADKMAAVCLKLYNSDGSRSLMEDAGELGSLLLSFVEELEGGVAALPQAVRHLLWTAAEMVASESSEPQLGRVVGEVYTTWLDGLPAPELLRSLLTTFTTLLRQALSGRPDHTPSPAPGSLHCAQALVGGGGGGGGEGGEGGVTFAEHEAAAQVMLMEKDTKESLQFVYQLLQANKQLVTEFLENQNGTAKPHPLVLPSNRCKEAVFDPLRAHCKLGRGDFDHNWLLESHTHLYQKRDGV